MLSKKRDKFKYGSNNRICMQLEPLKRLGLSESDIKVYLELLKLGTATVTQLAEASGVHRTNIYAILDKLKNMGLATYFYEAHNMKFKAADPKNLLNYLKESEESIQGILPDLQKIHEIVRERIGVEIFRGSKGIMSAFKDIIREKKECLGFGISGYFRKLMSVQAKQWLRDVEHYKIWNRYIYAEGTELIHPYFEVRTLPADYMSPVHTQIYGNKVLVTIWEPEMVAILITSKQIADNYRNHFKLLWSIAKKVPQI